MAKRDTELETNEVQVINKNLLEMISEASFGKDIMESAYDLCMPVVDFIKDSDISFHCIHW